MQDQQRRYADKRRLHFDFQVGDFVYLSTRHLNLRVPSTAFKPRFIGPFKITQIVNSVTARLQLPEEYGNLHNAFHFSLLKPSPIINTPVIIELDSPSDSDLEGESMLEIEQ